MPIATGDIKLRYSVTTGPGDSTAGTANTSLGEFMSTTDVPDGTLHNLFDVMSGDENAASENEYRGVFVFNDHATLTLESPKVWLSSEVAGGASAAIAIDATVASARNSASAQGEELTNEDTAPSGETFSAPTTKAAGLALGNLTADFVRQVFVRRTGANSAAKDNDGVTLRVEGDTGE
jgi:hypothetical protein